MRTAWRVILQGRVPHHITNCLFVRHWVKGYQPVLKFYWFKKRFCKAVLEVITCDEIVGFFCFFSVERNFFAVTSQNWRRHGIMPFNSQCDVMYNFSEISFDVKYYMYFFLMVWCCSHWFNGFNLASFENLSTSTFELEKHWTQSNVTYLQVRAIVIIVCQYSTLVYACVFDEISAIKWEMYDQVT